MKKIKGSAAAKCGMLSVMMRMRILQTLQAPVNTSESKTFKWINSKKRKSMQHWILLTSSQHYVGASLSNAVNLKRTMATNQWNYTLDVVLNASDVAIIQQFQSSLNSFPIQLGNNTEISDITFTAVCSSTATGFQCRCEDNFAWPYSTCVTYGACDSIVSGICTCIDAIPADGQSCQAISGLLAQVEYDVDVDLNFTDIGTVDALRSILDAGGFSLALGPTVNVTHINITTACDDIIDNTCGCINSIPTNGQYCVPQTVPLVFYEYQIIIEVNTSDADQLRNVLNSLTLPVQISSSVNILDANITTVCSQDNTGFQCHCENDYLWPCDKCDTYGKCDDFTACPLITTPSPTTTTPPPSTTPSPTTPPILFEYIILVELNTTDVTLINQLSNILRSIRYPFILNNTHILDVNISTVCSPSSSGYQCRCEDQYRWSCDQCLQYTSCDNITGDTCGCINAIPPDGQYCQPSGQNSKFYSLSSYNNSTTTNSSYNNSITNNSITNKEGSIFTDFDVETTEVNATELAEANREFSKAVTSTIAPVIGSVTALYISKSNIASEKELRIDGTIYKGDRMRLVCEPSINVGQISSVETLPMHSDGRRIAVQTRRKVIGDDIKSPPIIVSERQINVQCVEGQTVPLKCCVQSPFKVKWSRGSLALDAGVTENGTSFCRTYETRKEPALLHVKTVCMGMDDKTNYLVQNVLQVKWGIRSKCDNGKWKLVEDTCVIKVIKELLDSSEELQVEDVPGFVEKLSKEVKEIKNDVAKDPNTISAIVDILGNIAVIDTLVVNQPVIEDSRDSWTALNANESQNASSNLLGSMELLSDKINGTFTFKTAAILFDRSTFDNSFSANLNSSVVLDIPDTGFSNTSITTITFFTLNNVMPVRSSSSNPNNTDPVNALNAAVVLIKVNETIRNVTLSYTKLNTTLTQDPQCVFWNFKLFNNRGAWDSDGCEFVSDINDTVTCRCDHLTSFSILMSTGIPKELKELLDLITYVGVGISLASLVICLIIEGYVWKAITKNSTAFMRHVSIINTALSLLIADICFIIGAAIADNPAENPENNNFNVPVDSCSTATFFMHFFYLAVFFWMLVSGLCYFTGQSWSSPTCPSYGCPLIIAVVTVAVTAPGGGYITNKEACWLNWEQTRALLAFVIPALSIVCINIIIVIVVLFKMLRRGVGDAGQKEERHTLVVILRCVAILTPLFGLTWSLGVGTMLDSTNRGLHIVFALFNSLQGFFILVFGTLFDSKIRSILARKSPTTSTGSNTTRVKYKWWHFLYWSELVPSTAWKKKQTSTVCQRLQTRAMLVRRRMAIFKTCLSIFALLLTLTILETGNFVESPMATNQWNYTLDVVLNASDVAIIQQFQSSLNSFPIQLGNNTEISDITFTTVCSSTATGFQCRCEDNFAWPYSTCVTYGACDSIVSGICTCIDAIPADGQSCQAISGLLAQVEYDVDVDLNFTDIGTVDALRSILDAGGFSLALGPTVNVTHITITTATVIHMEPVMTSLTTRVVVSTVFLPMDNTASQTVPLVFYEYQIIIEVNTSDADQLRNVLNSLTLPVQISSSVNILDANITTGKNKCIISFFLYLFQTSAFFTRENMLFSLKFAAKITLGFSATVKMTIFGRVINFTACPLITTPSPTTLPSTTPSPTTPPILFEYIILVELNTTDVTLINQLSNILRSIRYPFILNNTHILDVQIQYCKYVKYVLVLSTLSLEKLITCVKFIVFFFGLKFALRAVLVTSADVRINIVGHVTSVYSIHPVTTSLGTHVDASMPFLLMDNTASLLVKTVNFTACPLITTPPLPTLLTTTPSPTTPSPTRFNLVMTVQLNKTFTETLNDPTSAAYNDLKDNMEQW
ncbi:hypothetical protein F7725_003961 [Dissostichus mawsoni]|uniref:Uncharacterized protein n=1 Tax=Dissostichus mawsoni TaxID=36200 RepID=A0A7J5YCN1_DISMA|nr:hypothetical protein F7725_003961 [Dissostichus mawsoni]